MANYNRSMPHTEHVNDDEHHRSHRAGWLRAGVLGANDGLLSTSSLLIGMAAAEVSRSTITLTGIAALAAGSLSMAAGEYASVASQRDAESADIAKERHALEHFEAAELLELQHIYEGRGLPKALARTVAEHLHEHDALAAHTREELGLDPDVLAKPVQAAVTSAISFALGAFVPLVVILVSPHSVRILLTVLTTIGALTGLGWTAANLGGAPKSRAIIRIVSLGIVSMMATALIGRIAGANI
jgi:vacuolar iron transporter family protein